MHLNLTDFMQENSGEFEKFMLDQAKICQKDTNASDQDVKEMLDAVTPTTKVAKCLNACLIKKLGIVSTFKITFRTDLGTPHSYIKDALLKTTVAIFEPQTIKQMNSRQQENCKVFHG